jgi:hypothetical protein
MSRLRSTLIALLVASTALFAVGVIVERSSADTHADPPAAHAEEANAEGTHSEGGESSATTSGHGGHAETSAESPAAHAEGERLLGVDLESTPLVVLAVLAGLALAVLAAGRVGRARAFLLAVAVIALAWAALDIREVVHQLDESRTGVAVIAVAVALLHLAAVAVSHRLAQRHVTGT